MPQITLPVRFYRLAPPDEGPFVEESFGRETLAWVLDSDETALVLVDCWDIHPYESHLERSNQICETILAPTAQACREAGIAVIHAPSPTQARKYPQWTKYASDAQLFDATGSEPPWPPDDARKGQEEYAQFKKPEDPRLTRWRVEKIKERRIVDCLEPLPEDFVISNGEQLHRLCHHQEIVHLIYGGFAANMCVPGRDYGTRAMNRRGYNLILLRDGTTAIEASETYETMGLTEASILETEMTIGTTALSSDLMSACRAVKE